MFIYRYEKFEKKMNITESTIKQKRENCFINIYVTISFFRLNLLFILFLLFQVVLKYFPGHEVDVGRIGLCIVLAGMMGSVVCGIVLDKTHRFK